MSWDVYLERDGRPVSVERHAEGGTYALGGTTSATLNVTYNYGARYREVFPGLQGTDVLWQMLDGHRAADTVESLERVVEELGTERDDDAWAPTPGNAGRAAETLLSWARQHPDAVWSVS